jgi:ubiquinone/menaquinone biosynthesis C-methylase UbiE
VGLKEGVISVDAVNLMKQDWDERARKDAFHYIASWRKDWTPETFFESGEEDYERLVAPFLARSQWKTEGKDMLELGCGAGRMTRSFSRRFSRVHAFDISAEMLGHAQVLYPEAPNINWTLGNGTDLASLPDQTVDFAFSYIVLQHMPDPAFALRYVQEMLRVLRPDGVFLFQFNSQRTMAMNWKGRAAWKIVDFPWSLGFRGVSRGVARLIGLSPEIAGKSWRGASIEVASVREAIVKSGGIVREIEGQDTPMTWCFGAKARTLNQ